MSIKITHPGSCLCGEIRYEINGDIDGILNYHCSNCRKSHGVAFRTRGAVNPDDFVFLNGGAPFNTITRHPSSVFALASK